MQILLSTLLVTSSVLVSNVVAQLPYNPYRLILSPDKSKVYQIATQASPVSFSYLDISKQITPSSAAVTLNQQLPFETSNRALVPVADNDGIRVLVGNCQDAGQAQLWKFTMNKDGKNGTWKDLQLKASDTSLSANYLSAAFSFSANGSTEDASLYVFGGMCPTGSSDTSSWTSQADYSSNMLSVASTDNQAPYQLSITGTRAPPIPEAGLTITPLSLISTKTAAGKMSQQQNFVLIGGHTQNAFINMSQVALFSLPEASWAFLGINQPAGTGGELVKRDAIMVEPRSGHTAVLTEDGTKIVVFGGWVGDVTSPATPQLAVLQLGQGYGGTGPWQWTIPKQTSNPLPSDQGIYGHGAVMLPGNVMMIAGGTNIGASKRKRSTQAYMFYNVDSATWSSRYMNSASKVSGGLDSSQKAGIGAGLGLGVAAIAAVLIAWWLYRKKLNAKRAERERHLRELAFGSERYQSSSRVHSRLDGRYGMSDVRSASWGSRQEQHIEGNGFSFPWSGHHNHSGKFHEGDSTSRGVERTGVEMEVPSPTRGLRKSLSTRGPASYGSNLPAPVTGPGSVFRIDEVEEEGSVRSIQVRTPAGSRMSDTFKDPPNLEPTSAAEDRKREVQGWVEGWQEAAATMNLSRNPSQVRTYSTLSQAQSNSGSSSYKTGRESPEKSDRTGSNLSERSEFSIQKSTGTVSRQMSQRSVSAGYALFSSAAAAMSRLGGGNRETALDRAASKRSISLNTSVPRRTTSSTQRPISGENRSLLHSHSPTKSLEDDSPIKDYKNYARTSSLTSQMRKNGILGSVKRVFTGTSQVDVQAQVEQYEEKVDEAQPEMSETATATAPVFLRGRKGAKDWNEEDTHPGQPSTSTATRRRSTMDGAGSVIDYDGEDWDVETAVQQRVVQVMFTMPKEKLRVVNADALSLISRSDIDEREDRERKTDLSRMSSLKEDGAEEESTDSKGKSREKS